MVLTADRWSSRDAPSLRNHDRCRLEYAQMWPSASARRSGAPGAAGGIRRCRGPAPDPARCLPMGHLAAGLVHQHARVEGGSKGIFYVLSQEHQLAREGCRSAVLAQPGQSRRAGRSSLSHRPPAGPQVGASRVAPGRPGEARRTPVPFLPAWRSSARERSPGPIPELRWSRLTGLPRGLAGRRSSSSRKRRRPQESRGRRLVKRNASVRCAVGGKMAG
jgi:hypothetical protein